MRKEQVPNLLTVGRVIAVPLFIACFYLPGFFGALLALLLFLAACVTDWLDGYLARRWSASSSFGAMLDPVADKLLVAAALILLALENRAPELAVLLIILRELLVSGLRETLAKREFSLPVTFLAKCKTTVQMLAILLALLVPLAEPEMQWLADLLMWAAALLTLYTGADYLARAIRFSLTA